MKKIFILFLFLICLTVNTYNAISVNKCMKELHPKNLNSKNIYDYFKENNLNLKVDKICSENLCSDLNTSNIENDIKNFVEKNINYLQNKNEEQALEAELKGFKIKKIFIYSCD